MNFSRFVANRLAFQSKESFARLIISIGVVAIGISLAVMITAVSITSGFKKEIIGKVTGFNSHVTITNLDMNNSYEAKPTSAHPDFLQEIQQLPLVQHVQVFAQKPGIIKTANDIEGVVIKGVGADFDWQFIRSCLREGEILSFSDSAASDKILVSASTAKKINISTGDKLTIYFIQQDEPVRARRLTVSGIFETGLEDYDKTFALADIRHIQRLYNWDTGQVQGFEVSLRDFNQMDAATEEINQLISYDLKAESAKDLKPQIFDWLSLLNMNVVIIIVLMIVVATINIITALLILILERTTMVGVLKSLGATNGQVRNIFLYKFAYLIGRGLLLGNVLAIGFCYLQMQTGFIRLDPESYYVSQVPVNLDWAVVLLLNAGTFLLCLVSLLLPSRIVSRISPVKTIRFD